MGRVTIKDIASAAGVSVGTVSKVLNGDRTIKEKNLKTVEEAIAQLHYARTGICIFICCDCWIFVVSYAKRW